MISVTWRELTGCVEKPTAGLRVECSVGAMALGVWMFFHDVCQEGGVGFGSCIDSSV
jgi:hypothetical protein